MLDSLTVGGGFIYARNLSHGREYRVRRYSLAQVSMEDLTPYIDANGERQLRRWMISTDDFTADHETIPTPERYK